MRITFLGTCAGTEPMPTRHHTSFVIEEKGRVYWFDAGEGCSRTAHLLGIDLLNVRNIIISHSHMDHIGGLANLLWHIKKISMVKGEKLRFGDIDVFLPDLEVLGAIEKILKTTLDDYGERLNITAKEISDGIIIDDGMIKVTAYHNHHLKTNKTAPWRSFTYKIESEGKTVVYSGDVGDYPDLDEPLCNGCDALIVETGHLKIDGVYEYTKDKNIGKILFNHCGREILNDLQGSQKKVEEKFKGKAIICEDKMFLEI